MIKRQWMASGACNTVTFTAWALRSRRNGVTSTPLLTENVTESVASGLTRPPFA